MPTPYQLGYNAGKRKRKPIDVTANPYPHLSDDWIKWNNGWNQGWYYKQELLEARTGYRNDIEDISEWQCIPDECMNDDDDEPGEFYYDDGDVPRRPDGSVDWAALANGDD